jgi:hypothetical protein
MVTYKEWAARPRRFPTCNLNVTGLRIGTGAFTAAGWAGSFYPKGPAERDFLSYYARKFDTRDKSEKQVPHQRSPKPGDRVRDDNFTDRDKDLPFAPQSMGATTPCRPYGAQKKHLRRINLGLCTLGFRLRQTPSAATARRARPGLKYAAPTGLIDRFARFPNSK